MEKEHQPESLSTVTIKPDYPPSEVYGSEPPPAYHKPQSSAVQVAKICAVTIVLVSVVLGSFILASAYVSANASCKQLEQELQLLSEAADRFQQPLQPEALIQEEPIAVKRHIEPLHAEESRAATKEIDNNSLDESDNSEDVPNNNSNDNSDNASDNSDNSSSDESDDEEEDRTPIHFKLPLQLDFDDLAGALIDKNQRSRMNCIVEKKRAEEVVDHQPKTVRLPFGVNLTTDPRYERLSGERMAIFCESGNMQSHSQPQEEEEEETIMIQPVMIPIPASHFPTHMPQQMQPMPPQQQYQQQYQHQMQVPLHPMETMRPPMPPMRAYPAPVAEVMEGRANEGPQQAMVGRPMPPQVRLMTHVQQPQQMPEEDNSMPPPQILHHIAQQIITQKIMEAQKARAEQLAREQAQRAQEMPQQEMQTMHRIPVGEEMMAHRLPIPEEVLSQLNRLPNREVILAVQEQEPEEEEQNQQQQQQQQQEVRIVQQPRQSPHEMSGRQGFARGMPIDIPVPMMQQIQREQQEPQPEESEQHEQVAMAEEQRPHYVQPRSVRSVDALLPKSTKRVKRCACDCAC